MVAFTILSYLMINILFIGVTGKILNTITVKLEAVYSLQSQEI